MDKLLTRYNQRDQLLTRYRAGRGKAAYLVLAEGQAAHWVPADGQAAHLAWAMRELPSIGKCRHTRYNEWPPFLQSAGKHEKRWDAWAERIVLSPAMLLMKNYLFFWKHKNSVIAQRNCHSVQTAHVCNPYSNRHRRLPACACACIVQVIVTSTYSRISQCLSKRLSWKH